MLQLEHQWSPRRTTMIGVVVASGVAIVACLLRLSSCYESFWVDELHTAWAIDGDWHQVRGRAALGNQMPVYFWGLWIWKNLFGDSEIALRLTSVLAVAAAAGAMTFSVARHCRSLVAGVASGMVLAVEANATFFATELRPYAVVLLASVFAIDGWFTLIRPDTAAGLDATSGTDATSIGIRRDRAAWQLTIAMVLVVLCQPANFAAVAWLPLTAWAFGRLGTNHEPWLRVSLNDGLRWTLLVAALLAAWQWTLLNSWAHRDHWATFATARSWNQWWHIWPWAGLLIVPLTVSAVLGGIRTTLWRCGFGIALIAIAATTTYWLASWAGWVPLWHRRYFIVVLPMLATVPGCCVASVHHGGWASVWRRLSMPAFRFAMSLVVALASLGWMMWQQRTPSGIARLPRPLVARGEDWRGAIGWLDEQLRPGDTLYVDAGLIEYDAYLQRGLSEGRTASVPGDSGPIAYLTLPVHGPYRVNVGDGEAIEVRPIDRDLLFPLEQLGAPMNSRDRVWILSRRNKSAMKATLRQSIRRSGPFDYRGVRVAGFGNVSVAEIPWLNRPPGRGWLLPWSR
ncbi:glycosyltransferase family 39 protein [Crateriforma conspicua]|nr:glycosyltransferase family 39 protein [Crateriforma conspicua]